MVKAGDVRDSAPLTPEDLIEQAMRGRTKFEAQKTEIDRLHAAGVTVRAIVAWLNSQGIKSEPGELWRWLKRRQTRQAKQQEMQSPRAGGGEPRCQSVPKNPEAAPAHQDATPAPAATTSLPPALLKSSRAPDPSDRPGTSEHEKELDARIEKALQESRAKRSPFALKSKAAEKK